MRDPADLANPLLRIRGDGMIYEFEIPVRTVSEANMREHWGRKAERTRNIRAVVAIVMRQPTVMPKAGWTPLPKTITMTRIAPRMFDSDNSIRALKAVRDEIAKQIGIDDGDDRLTWRYEQRKGKVREHSVIVRIEE